jgi:hypothetical protein
VQKGTTFCRASFRDTRPGPCGGEKPTGGVTHPATTIVPYPWSISAPVFVLLDPNSPNKQPSQGTTRRLHPLLRKHASCPTLSPPSHRFSIQSPTHSILNPSNVHDLSASIPPILQLSLPRAVHWIKVPLSSAISSQGTNLPSH